MKVSPNFDIRELVHPDIHEAHGDRCPNFISAFLPVTLESLKENLTEVVTVNNWIWGGNRDSAGLRPDGDPDGAKLSTHKFGNTADPKFKHHTAEEVYYHILSNPHKYPHIIRMEHIDHTPTWVHIEVGPRRYGDIIIFNP